MKSSSCIFCQMVLGIEPYHLVWQDDRHLAFLSIFPNTPGVTVVIPKKHYSSYIYDVPDEVMHELMKASKNVAILIDQALPDVSRTAVVFEGFGINHLHVKLFPLHGTKQKSWQPISSKENINTFYHKYPGYVSSHSAARADDKKLVDIAKKIRGKTG